MPSQVLDECEILIEGVLVVVEVEVGAGVDSAESASGASGAAVLAGAAEARSNSLAMMEQADVDAEADAMGLKAPDSGLKVTGVIAGLPGAIAGLQPGDFIIEFANAKFTRGQSLESLQKMHMDLLMGKQGNKLQTKLIRNGKTETLVVNLK